MYSENYVNYVLNRQKFADVINSASNQDFLINKFSLIKYLCNKIVKQELQLVPVLIDK